MSSTLRSIPSEGRSDSQTLAVQAEIQKLSKAATQYFSHDDINLALTRFKKAYVLSCSLPEKNIQKICLFNLGAAYISVAKPKKGLKCLMKSVTKEHAEKDGDLYFNIGAAYNVLKDHAKALKFYEKAINTYGLNKINSISDALIKVGYCFTALGNLPSAAHAFKLAGKSYQTGEKYEDAAMAMREAANYMLKSQAFSRMEVLQMLNAAVKICEKISDESLLAKLYNHLGLHYAEIKCFTEAATCISESMRHCSGRNFSIQKMAVLLQNSGAIENAMGQFEASLASHAEAADMFGVFGDRNAQGQCLCNLAYAFSQLKNYERAEFYYQQALKAFGDAGVLRGQWQTCEGLAATHFCQGNTDQAISSYKHALALFVKSKETSDIFRDRILRKLTNAIEYKATQEHPVPSTSSRESSLTSISSSTGSETGGSGSTNRKPPVEHSVPIQNPKSKESQASDTDEEIASVAMSQRHESNPKMEDNQTGKMKSKVCSIS